MGHSRNIRRHHRSQRRRNQAPLLSLPMAHLQQGKQPRQGNKQLHQQVRTPVGHNRRIRHRSRSLIEPPPKDDDSARRQLERRTHCGKGGLWWLQARYPSREHDERAEQQRAGRHRRYSDVRGHSWKVDPGCLIWNHWDLGWSLWNKWINQLYLDWMERTGMGCVL